MAVIEIAKVQIRRGQELQTGIPQLDSGEFGWAEDTENLYIGKRIVDGAVDDQNTRILTENDLTNIFAFVQGNMTDIAHVTTSSGYLYRNNIPNVNATTSTIGIALDASANLTNWGVTRGISGANITAALTSAVQGLYANSTTNARSQLRIPAGVYEISNTIYLPPYANIVGEGAGLTTLIMTSNSGPMFQTIDSNNKTYEQSMSNSRATQPRYINLEGMTLQFNTGTTSTFALLSLDNVYNATVKSVNFSALASDSQLFEVSEGANAVTGSSGVDSLTINTTVNADWAFVTPDSGLWYITGNNAYLNQYSQILTATTGSGTITFATTSTTGVFDFSQHPSETYYLLQYNGTGVGISLRGQGGGYFSDQVHLTDNIQISNCQFSNLGTAFLSTGSATRMILENNIFKNAVNGIVMEYVPTADTAVSIGPTNGLIKNNRFEAIIQEAIYVGSNNGYPTNHISSNNYFDQCGNGAQLADLITTSTLHPVVSFQSPGNTSENDFFNRRRAADYILTNTNVNPKFFYNPLVVGSVNVEDRSVNRVTANAQTVTPVVSFPITKTEQYIEIKYQMSSGVISRKGVITLNVNTTTNGGNSGVSISDVYDYTEIYDNYSKITNDSSTDNLTAIAHTGPYYSGPDVLVVTSSTSAALAPLVGTGATRFNFYLTGAPGNSYANQSAYVQSVSLYNGCYIIQTQSSNPQFVYTPGSVWELLIADSVVFNASVDTTTNSIIVKCDTTQAYNGVTIDYQTNIFL